MAKSIDWNELDIARSERYRLYKLMRILESALNCELRSEHLCDMSYNAGNMTRFQLGDVCLRLLFVARSRCMVVEVPDPPALPPWSSSDGPVELLSPV